MAAYPVREIKQSETDKFREFLLANHFSAGYDEVFNWYSSFPGTSMYIAADGERIAGTGMSFSMGRTGWLGSICVDPEYRRKGLGTALTEFGIDRLREQGAESILLRASTQGYELYRSLGFRETGRYENFVVEKSPAKESPLLEGAYTEIRRLEDRHFQMDLEVSGEDRKAMLQSMPPAVGLEVSDGAEASGFIYPTISGGFLCISPSAESIAEMMDAMLARGGFKIRTLVGGTGNNYLRKKGLVHQDGAARMALGPDPIKNIEKVVGTISSSIG